MFLLRVIALSSLLALAAPLSAQEALPPIPCETPPAVDCILGAALDDLIAAEATSGQEHLSARLGIVLSEAGYPDLGERLLDLVPDGTERHMLLSELARGYARWGDTAAALAVIDRIAADWRRDDAREAVVTVLAERGDRGAAEQIAAAIGGETKRGRALFTIAQAWIGQGDLAAAERVTALNPDPGWQASAEEEIAIARALSAPDPVAAIRGMDDPLHRLLAWRALLEAAPAPDRALAAEAAAFATTGAPVLFADDTVGRVIAQLARAGDPDGARAAVATIAHPGLRMTALAPLAALGPDPATDALVEETLAGFADPMEAVFARLDFAVAVPDPARRLHHLKVLSDLPDREGAALLVAGLAREGRDPLAADQFRLLMRHLPDPAEAERALREIAFALAQGDDPLSVVPTIAAHDSDHARNALAREMAPYILAAGQPVDALLPFLTQPDDLASVLGRRAAASGSPADWQAAREALAAVRYSHARARVLIDWTEAMLAP